jgi:hypothetical protein
MWLTPRRTVGYRFAFLGEPTCVYHQVAGARGAVADAYLTAPTPFTLARARLYGTWPAVDLLVSGYRDWFGRFDRRLDHRIKQRLPVPAHVFEHAVRRLYLLFNAGLPADPAVLDMLLPDQEEAAHAAP